MKIQAWLVYYQARYSGQEFYWTGDFLPNGAPQVSSNTALARGFTSAREAYDAVKAAATETRRQRMLWWHVGLRRVRTRVEVAA